MSTNLGIEPKNNDSWMNLPRFILCLFFFLSTSAYATGYEEGKKAYLGKNYEQALKILKPLAEEGNSQAQITLGLMYDYGQGVDKDPSESLKWYIKNQEIECEILETSVVGAIWLLQRS